MKDLPLLDLFTKLRSAGLPLGVDDYQAVLRSLQGGYGLTDRVALARVCRMLWVRSADEQQLFDYYFQQILGDPKPEITDETEILKILKNSDLKATQEDFNKLELIYAVMRTTAYAALLGALFLMTGSGLFMYRELSYRTQTESRQSAPVSAQAPQPTPIQPVPTTNPNIWVYWSFGLLIISAMIGGGLLVKVLLQVSKQQPQVLESSTETRSKSENMIAPQVLRDLNDEVAIAQALQQMAPGKRSYAIAQDYLPVTQRQLKQSWRYLRQLVREGIATELDIEATTQQIAQCGMLLEPVVVPPRQNRTELLLLVDQDGSMAAFRSLAERLTETAARGGRLGKMGIFYFRNCPIGSLYRDPLHLDAEPVADVLAQLRRDRTVVLIFSDGGAARGGFSRDRVTATTEFLAKLQSQVRRVVWLNPMPQSRWAGTTAAEIARSVPMFEATRQGIEGAIGTLRGRYHGKVQRGGDRA